MVPIQEYAPDLSIGIVVNSGRTALMEPIRIEPKNSRHYPTAQTDLQNQWFGGAEKRVSEQGEGQTHDLS